MFFLELLDASLGELEHSVHFTFMVEMGWLLAQYAVAGISKPSVFVYYGVHDDEIDQLPGYLREKVVHVDTGDQYGHHHTLVFFFFYE